MIALLLLLPGVMPTGGPGTDTKPAMLEGVTVVERLGQKVPLDLPFTDGHGHTAPLRSYVSGRRPIVLTLVYYRCPMLCNVLLGGLVKDLRALDDWKLGREYDAVSVSFDPEDDPGAAAEKQRGFLQALEAPEQAWPFLVGKPREITQLAEAVGFKYRRDPATGQFAHTAVVFVLAPDGTISRYLYGIEFPQRQLKLALTEASAGRVGSTFERFLLHCYRWDPSTRKYGLFVRGFLQTGGGIVFVVLAVFLGRFWWRERRRA